MLAAIPLLVLPLIGTANVGPADAQKSILTERAAFVQTLPEESVVLTKGQQYKPPVEKDSSCA